jgi:hypothetical protein
VTGNLAFLAESAAPQSPQNFLPAGLSLPHFERRISSPIGDAIRPHLSLREDDDRPPHEYKMHPQGLVQLAWMLRSRRIGLPLTACPDPDVDGRAAARIRRVGALYKGVALLKSLAIRAQR